MAAKPSLWQKSRLVVLAGALIAVVILVFQAERVPVVNGFRDGVRLLAKGGGAAWSGVTYPFRLVQQVVVMHEEGAYVRKELQRLRQENIDVHETLRAYQRLEKLLAFQPPVGYRGVPASVVAYEPTNFVGGCMIDRGAKDGVFPAMVVMTADGVVGRVLAVSGGTSRVAFLSDPNCRVSVLVERSRVMGIVAGTGGRECEMLYVSADEDVQEGDRLLTSGQGGVYPKGLLVGRVSKVERSSSSIMLLIRVEPFVKFSRLEEVLLAFPLRNL